MMGCSQQIILDLLKHKSFQPFSNQQCLHTSPALIPKATLYCPSLALRSVPASMALKKGQEMDQRHLQV
jgi:hypothetical protein